MDLAGPFRILQQGAADSDHVKFAFVEALDHVCEWTCLRPFAAEGACKLCRKANRADCDGWEACQLLSPAGKVQAVFAIDLREFRLPITTLRAVNAVYACISQNACTGSAEDIMDQYLHLTKSYTKRHHDYGFDGDPIHPIGSQYYGYLTQTTSF